MDIFYIRTETADGYPLHIGGFCKAGKSDLASRCFAGIQGKLFNQITDPYLVDVQLSWLLRDEVSSNLSIYEEAGIVQLAACLRVQNASAPCGAVLGDCRHEAESAFFEAWQVTGLPHGGSLYRICFPGQWGAAYTTDSVKDASKIRDELRRLSVLDDLPESIALLQGEARNCLFVSDSGILYASGNRDTKYEIIA